MTTSAPTSHSGKDRERSSYEQNAPRMGFRGLTAVLIFMCVVPTIVVFTIWRYLPPVEEGTLQASVSAIGLPSVDYYQVEYDKRPSFAGGELIVTNESEQEWTHLNIQVNGSYQIYDIQPIPAGGTARFQLDRFVSRTGARFSIQYNELKSVRIYARRPTKDRATFYHDFETVEAGKRTNEPPAKPVNEQRYD